MKHKLLLLFLILIQIPTTKLAYTQNTFSQNRLIISASASESAPDENPDSETEGVDTIKSINENLHKYRYQIAGFIVFMLVGFFLNLTRGGRRRK